MLNLNKRMLFYLTNLFISYGQSAKDMILAIGDNIFHYKPSLNYVSSARSIVGNNVFNYETVSKVRSKAWLIGFTEAEGSFYLVQKTTNRLVHAFEITQKLDSIVLIAIKHILGISSKVLLKKTNYYSISTTNSRAIEKIIKYFSNTMKGLKSLEYRIWSRSYVKYKGYFNALNKIRNRVRLFRLKPPLALQPATPQMAFGTVTEK